MYGFWTFLFTLLFYGSFAQSEKDSTGFTDITFFVGSDLHFENNDSIPSINQAVADDMSAIPGTPYPDSLLGKVDIPDWVSFTGDITDHGRANEWKDFTTIFGLNGDKDFPFLVYEGFGNHDGPIDGVSPSPVRNGIKTRNMQREGLTRVSSDSLHYSWDREGVHFVNLNSYPGKKWDSTCEWCHYFNDGFRDPAKSLNFLKKDLRKSVGKSNRPVILFFHYGFDDWGDKWWTKEEQDAFYKTIKRYNVLAIFHGHTHVIHHYDWKNIPVWCVGATQKSPDIGEYLVVRIQDRQLLVAVRKNRNWDKVFVGRPIN